MQVNRWPFGNYIGPGRRGLSWVWRRIWSRRNTAIGCGANAKRVRICPTMLAIEAKRCAKVAA